ncbi:enoyl-CoA hydratase/isomerase family protein [Bradyrhizobium jicamae]|uniref:enoyl-CoA hydratase/isomerase family protein n=1 Tax=Bradyrhizobium jicamae TaxID=280332 RepID=UPI001BABD3A6|nr:enoyl-CoA hydratase/isomerase family protein [Bradyrhizobium jicamae]MBR0756250.1 enoyl-CoA hydratase/isomerase family protein [Bradyrhizobium jicamae]
MERQNGSADAIRLDWPLPEVARLTLARGSELNTLTFELIESLHHALDTALAERARVVIMTGDGRAFCSGAHITYFTDPAAGLADDPAGIRDVYVKSIVAAFRKLQDAPFATIAAINGFALGGGCELALSCDFRLMAARARIGLTEARLGAVPGAGGLQLLARIVGRARALEMILLADQWSAEQALSAGLVTAVHDREELSEAALALARRLLLCSPTAIAASKAAIYACETANPDEADEIALDAVRHVAGAPDWREGMTAFAERRPPGFAVNGKRSS